MRLEKTLGILILCDVVLVVLGIVADWATGTTRFGNFFLTALWVSVAIGTTFSWIGLLNLVRGARHLYCASWIGYFMLTLFSGPVVSSAVVQAVQMLGALVGGAILAIVYFTELNTKFLTIRESWRGIMPKEN
jgi:hypothetical protein